MPSAFIKSLAGKSKASKREAEKRWAQAKKIVKDGYDYDEKDPRYWALVTTITKKLLGLSEDIGKIGFKIFLEAAFEKGEVPKIESHDLETALHIFENECSDAAWMIEQGPLWRGTYGREVNAKIGVVDTSLTRRRSQNTTNHYSEIMDNISELKDFPKRQYSVIASTSFNVAASYGDKRYAIIPFNGVKIGVCPTPDIWDLHMPAKKLAKAGKMYPTTINDFLAFKMHVADKWEAIVEFDKKLSAAEDSELLDEYYDGTQYFENDKFIEELVKELALLKVDGSKFEYL